MAKLVILEIGQGSFEQGFPVTLQIGEDGANATIKKFGRLPPAPEMPVYYHRWQSHYKELDQIYRLSAVANPPPARVSRSQLLKKCQDLSKILQDRLNAWIRTPEFQEIRMTWFKAVGAEDLVRAIVQVGDREMQQLPWHLLDMVQGYAQLEIAVGASFEQPFTKPIAHSTVNILAILGDSRGINTQADAAILNQLPNTEVEFLVEPDRAQLSDRLWERPWDVLFFAGHSASQQNYESGVIYLNNTDKLTVGELKHALRKAVERGLKLAIFNSCDGLGLARELAELNIPQVIVMREPVPDRVAQTFLKYFLQAYSQGEPLYLAVRQARERLEALEDQFPCATWLPMIFQNLAEVPPLWKLADRAVSDGTVLGGAVLGGAVSGGAVSNRDAKWWRLGRSLLIGGVTALAVMGVRSQGWLQPWELTAYDSLFHLRSTVQPLEPPDDRIVVITIDQRDIDYQKTDFLQRRELQAWRKLEPAAFRLNDKSISDAALVQLLSRIDVAKPAAVGLDLLRDSRSQEVSPKLGQRFAAMSNLAGVCVRNLGNGTPDYPPYGVPVDQVTFADVILDNDNVIRRHLYLQAPEKYLSKRTHPCNAEYALSFDLVWRYWAVKFDKEATGRLPDGVRLGKAILQPLSHTPGGYRAEQVQGDQILLNYRDREFATLSLSSVLRGESLSQLRDKIVLIGTNKLPQDQQLTPYTQGSTLETQTPGVFVQAQMTSQLLSAALGERSLLWVWHPLVEGLWVVGWALVGGVIVWGLRSPQHRVLGIGFACVFSYGICGVIFVQFNGWVPWVPVAITLVGAATVAILVSSIGTRPSAAQIA